MADISMCSGKGCKQKERCYRFTATKGMMQSFFGTPPMETDTECEYFWDNN
jgi:hypothetical protein